MFSSSGYFRGVVCPYFTNGLCERPYCHFKHIQQPDASTINYKASLPSIYTRQGSNDSSSDQAYQPVAGAEAALRQPVPYVATPRSLLAESASRPAAKTSQPQYVPTPLHLLKQQVTDDEEYNPDTPSCVSKSCAVSLVQGTGVSADISQCIESAQPASVQESIEAKFSDDDFLEDDDAADLIVRNPKTLGSARIKEPEVMGVARVKKPESGKIRISDNNRRIVKSATSGESAASRRDVSKSNQKSTDTKLKSSQNILLPVKNIDKLAEDVEDVGMFSVELHDDDDDDDELMDTLPEVSSSCDSTGDSNISLYRTDTKVKGDNTADKEMTLSGTCSHSEQKSQNVLGNQPTLNSASHKSSNHLGSKSSSSSSSSKSLSNHGSSHRSSSNYSSGHRSSSNHSSGHRSSTNHSSGHKSSSNHSSGHRSSTNHSSGHRSSSNHSSDHKSTSNHSLGHKSTSNHSLGHKSSSNHSLGHKSSSNHSSGHKSSSNFFLSTSSTLHHSSKSTNVPTAVESLEDQDKQELCTENFNVENSDGSENSSTNTSSHQAKHSDSFRDHRSSSNDHSSSSKDHRSSSKDHKSSSKDHRSSSKDHRSSSKDHRSSSKDHRSSSKDHRSSPKDRRSSSKDHRSSSKDHRSSSKDHRSSSKDHRSSSKDHRSSSKDHRSSSKDHRSSSKDHRSSSKDHRSSSKDHRSLFNEDGNSSNSHEKLTNDHKKPSTSHKATSSSHGKSSTSSSVEHSRSSREHSSSSREHAGSKRQHGRSSRSRDDRSSSGSRSRKDSLGESRSCTNENSHSTRIGALDSLLRTLQSSPSPSPPVSPPPEQHSSVTSSHRHSSSPQRGSSSSSASSGGKPASRDKKSDSSCSVNGKSALAREEIEALFSSLQNDEAKNLLKRILSGYNAGESSADDVIPAKIAKLENSMVKKSAQSVVERSRVDLDSDEEKRSSLLQVRKRVAHQSSHSVNKDKKALFRPAVTVMPSAAEAVKRHQQQQQQKMAARGTSDRPVKSQSSNSEGGAKSNLSESESSKSTISQSESSFNIVGGARVRVAHQAKYPVEKAVVKPVIVGGSVGKISAQMRQTTLNKFFDQCKKMYDSAEDAKQRALNEEEQLLEGSGGSRCIYQSHYVTHMKRLMSELKQAPDSAPSGLEPGRWSHQAVLGGAKAASTSFTMNRSGRSQSVPDRLTTRDLYEGLQQYILSVEEQRENSYPLMDEGGGVMIKSSHRDVPAPHSSNPHERLCCRCGKRFEILPNGSFVKQEKCIYHYGKAWKKKVGGAWSTQFTCCGGDSGAVGCQVAVCHVHEHNRYTDVSGYVRTAPPATDSSLIHCGIYALDCEMVYTTHGNELARVTVIGSDLSVVLDEVVRPDHPVLDPNTRFSGLTVDMLQHVTTSLSDVQSSLLALFNSKTILIGHSLESDLTALKMVHDTVVDTSIVFPHKLGAPYKKALRTLANDILRKIIQDSVEGHDSTEDATVCMELMIHKIKDDMKKSFRHS